MSKITLQDLVNLENETSAVTLINSNSTIIQDAFDNTLSLDGTAPNQMQALLDLNSNQIINLPAPAQSSSPLRLQDLNSFVGGGTVTNIPSGGTTGQVLEKNSNANFDVKWATGGGGGSGTVTSVGLTLPADLTVSGSPVTSTGTLSATWANETANTVHAGPASGSAATPTWRAMVPADLPTVTLTGNVTGAASAGSIATTIGANQVTNAMHATQADSTIKSNISGSTAIPSDNTIAAVLDKQLGTTQGSVAFRSATAWAPLSPGSSGTILTSGGPAANPTWTAASGSGTVTSIVPSYGLTSTITGAAPGSSITTSGTLYSDYLVNAQTGTTYAILDTDRAKIITAVNAAAQAYSIAAAGAASAFQAGWFADVQNNSTNVAGIITVTPTTSTINGASTLKIQPGQYVRIVSDGTNYQVYGLANGRQLLGTTTSDNANTGCIGEYLVSTINNGAGPSLTTATSANITSISLTAGDWDVFGVFGITGTATALTAVQASFSTTTATMNNSGNAVINDFYNGNNVFAQTAIAKPMPVARFALASTTTMFLVTNSTFTGGTATGWGTIAARRVR